MPDPRPIYHALDTITTAIDGIMRDRDELRDALRHIARLTEAGTIRESDLRRITREAIAHSEESERARAATLQGR